MHGMEFLHFGFKWKIPFRYVLTDHEPKYLQVVYENSWFHADILKRWYEYEWDYFLEKSIEYLYSGKTIRGKKKIEEIWSTIHLFLRCQGAPLRDEHWERFMALEKKLEMPIWKTDPLNHVMAEVCAPHFITTPRDYYNSLMERHPPNLDLAVSEQDSDDTLFLLYHLYSGFPYTVLSGSELTLLKTKVDVTIISSEETSTIFCDLPRSLYELCDLIVEQLRLHKDTDEKGIGLLSSKFLLGIVPIQNDSDPLPALSPILQERIENSKALDYFRLTRNSTAMPLITYFDENHEIASA